MIRPDPMLARGLVGYGAAPPDPAWPGVNFNLNIEGGGASSLANGDAVSEAMPNDIGVPEFRGIGIARHWRARFPAQPGAQP